MFIEITSYYRDFLNDGLVLLFVAALIVDNVLGHVKAIRTRMWTSKVGTNGILRHAAVVTVVFILLPAMSYYMTDNTASNGILLVIVGVYMVSIMENLTHLGFPLTDKITKYFPQMQGHNEKDKED